MADWLPFAVAIVAGLVSGLSTRSVIRNEVDHLWRAVRRLDKVNDKHDVEHANLWQAVSEARRVSK